MNFSKRELSLIDILLRENDYLSAQDLADKLKMSAKTIYRTVKRVNEESATNLLIVSEKGKGYRLDYDTYLKANYIKKERAQTPIERRKYIMLYLLFRSPNSVHLDYLYDKYFLSVEAINKDVYAMRDYLSSQKLELVKQHRRLNIIGQEKDIREEINRVINDMEILDETSLLLKDGFSNDYDVTFIRQQVIEKIEVPLKKEVPYPYNINIIAHLTILINRFREGRVLQMTSETISSEEQKRIAENEELYLIAYQVIDNVSRYLSVSLPEIEVYYLFQYLVSSGISYCQSTNESLLAEGVTSDYIELISQHYPQVMARPKLYLDLVNHIRPMLYRVKRQMSITNGMLSEIKGEYALLHDIVCMITRRIEKRYEIKRISEDEIGFITIYFAKHLEAEKYSKKILIVCSSGVGTSELLRVKVTNAFPEIEIVEVLPYRKFLENIEKYQEIDLILTTVNFTNEVTIPHLLVNCMFTVGDKKMVKKIMSEV
ncbi:PRD domain-containing protein [Vagococcus sp. BWB3-3]|uniref:PRD domain-containing protein n=1 Tax=Vagococcus allomyrinae TaxID=2794353 RepID=A0A940P7A4_9ENTE|nr:PRD domain-containing protein [Vagococcus allomyrinae]MBP1041041.1 PRD domain-containing protein [Vagococcus allomyrinae]